MRSIRTMLMSLGALTLLGGCASSPPATFQAPATGVTVLSFAVERGVRTTNMNGPVETRPGMISLGTDGFDTPVLDAVGQLWAQFPAAAGRILGGGEWTGPGTESDHPAWVAASSEPLSSASFDFRKARGFFWPEGLRFVDGGTSLTEVAKEYPGQYLLTVEYTMAAEDVGSATDFRFADFRIALHGVFTLYGTEGQRLSRVEVTGRSATKVPRRGVALDRNRFPDLAVEAQEDALVQWGRAVKFD